MAVRAPSLLEVAGGLDPPLRTAGRQPTAVQRSLGAARQRIGASAQSKPGRLLSLDAFRGLAVALMLLVNNLALDTYTPTQLRHAPWKQGAHLADLVFPWFLFCVGVAIPFSGAAFRRQNLPAWRYDLKVLRRAALLVLLGCLIESSITRRLTFALGVLQILGLAYMVGALLYDLPLSRRLVVAGGLLGAYWALLRFGPVPGVGAGVASETQNFVAYVNRTYLMGLRLAGLPSVVPTAALVIIGTVIGDLLRSPHAHHLRRVASLLVVGLGFIAAGMLWSASLDFSKALWTPSFILLSAGTGSVILGLLYLLIDANAWYGWAYPLAVLGANAILAYVAPILAKTLVLQVWQVKVAGSLVSVQQWLLDCCVGYAGRVTGGWLYTLGFILAWWLVLWQLHRRRVLVRV